jgi:ComF family protein
MAQTVVDDVVSTVFPSVCRCCEGPLTRAGVVPVCDACVACVRPSELFGCARCGEALDLDLDLEDMRFAGMLTEGFQCRECKLAAPEFARAVAFATYDSEMRGLVRLLKFGRVQGVARLLGRQMAEALLQLEVHAGADAMVVAVPLFRQRQRERGFNQAVLLADEAMHQLRRLRPEWKLERAHTVLERRRSTESSFVLSRKGRRRNLAGAFQVTGEVRGREVVLVDDIYTSGATARECARVLMRAGAARVWVATLARAQKSTVVRAYADASELVAGWDLAVNHGERNQNRRTF